MQISLKNSLSNHKNKFIWLIFAAVGISTLQIPAIFVGPSLDAAGLIALTWISMHHLQIGQDLISQFGPFAYSLVAAYVEPSPWFQALVQTTIVHFVFTFSIALLLMKLRANWKDIVLVATLVLTLSNVTTQAVDIDEQLPFAATIFFYLIITGKINNKFAYPLLSFLALLLAIQSLIKVNIAIVTIGIVIIYSLIFITKKDFKKALVISASYIFLMMILWVVSEQNIVNFPSYFIEGLEISSGYNYAMATDGPVIELFSAMVAISFLIIFFIYSFTKKFNNLIILFLLNILILYSAFKHGFVRQDGHVLYFYFTYGAFFISTYLIYKYDIPQAVQNNKKLILLIVLILGAILLVVSIDIISPTLIVPKVPKNLLPWGEVYSLTFDKSYQTQRIEEHREFLMKYSSIDERTIHYIGNKTMDVFPWDTDIPWIYNFNWSPRPLPWSFEVFTTFTDELNALHFLDKRKAPQEILYSYKSIDGRYPLYDEPVTFEAILENYQYVNMTNDFALLSHNPRQDIGKKVDLGTVEAKIEKPIKIPKYNSGYVFANIDLEFNSHGKIMNIIYKPSMAHIIFKFSDSTYSQEFRLIPGTSNDGIFVSQYVDSIYDIKSIFSGKITPNIDEMTISVDNPADYESKIQVKFVGVPAQISIQESKENENPDWGSLRLVKEGGSMYIDTLGNKPFSQQDNVININKFGKQLVGISGWAVDGLSRDGTVNTFLVFHDGEKEITLPTHKGFRPDVAKFFGVDSYQYGGWSTALDTEEFGHGCYTLSLRIERTNGQEYFEMDSGKTFCFN